MYLIHRHNLIRPVRLVRKSCIDLINEGIPRLNAMAGTVSEEGKLGGKSETKQERAHLVSNAG